MRRCQVENTVHVLLALKKLRALGNEHLVPFVDRVTDDTEWLKADFVCTLNLSPRGQAEICQYPMHD